MGLGYKKLQVVKSHVHKVTQTRTKPNSKLGRLSRRYVPHTAAQ
jgi:hypothetical protein